MQYVMSAAERNEPIAVRLRAQRLAAELYARTFFILFRNDFNNFIAFLDFSADYQIFCLDFQLMEREVRTNSGYPSH